MPAWSLAQAFLSGRLELEGVEGNSAEQGKRIVAVLSLYCYGTNYYKLTGLKQHPAISSLCCRSEGYPWHGCGLAQVSARFCSPWKLKVIFQSHVVVA